MLPACAGFPREFAETTTVFFTGAGSPYVRIYLHDESVVIFDFSLILSLFFFFAAMSLSADSRTRVYLNNLGVEFVTYFNSINLNKLGRWIFPAK